MVKAVFLDFWGTIVENGIYPSPLKQTKYILWVEGPFSYFVQQFEKAFMRRKFSDLTSAFKSVCEELGLAYTDEQIEKLVGMWNKNKLLAKPFPETEDVLKQLHDKGYKLILISNTEQGVEELLDKFNIRQYFDATLLSCETGLLKSDPEIYAIACDKAGCTKDEALMVGDSVESDVKGAQKAGIKSVLLDRHDRMQHTPKIHTLLDIEEYINSLH